MAEDVYQKAKNYKYLNILNFTKVYTVCIMCVCSVLYDSKK